LLDIFRVKGGTQHDWCFHGPPFSDFSISGGELGSIQLKGTLAGEGVAYGCNPSEDLMKRKSEIPFELKKSPDVIMGPGGYWILAKLGWTSYYGDALITCKQGSNFSLKSDKLIKEKANVLVRYYDYNKGFNEIDISISGVTKTLRLGASGKEGYKWANMTFMIAHPVDSISVSAHYIGQIALIIDRIVISEDLNKIDLNVQNVSSGFQGLFNVKRMFPDKAWSVTWRRPDDHLSLSMKMLSGSAQEVIIADGLPELRKKNPETIKYVLARNNAMRRGESEIKVPLSSNYVAVIEPFLGNKASIVNIEKLVSNNISDETVGLIVHRNMEKDYIHSSVLTDKIYHWGENSEFNVDGEFAILTIDEKGVKRALLVNGTFLQYGNFSLKSDPPPSGKVVSVNHKENSIIIDKALNLSIDFRDKEVMFGNKHHNTSYTIKNVNIVGDKTTLDFGNVPFIIRMGDVNTKLTNEECVISETPIKGNGYVEGDRLLGRWIYNEDQSMGFRINAIKGNNFYIEKTTKNLNSFFNDTDGDGKSKYWVSDIGPGDSFRIPITAYYER
jgi:hypothetical protein